MGVIRGHGRREGPLQQNRHRGIHAWVHYAPAGENRGYLSRTGLAQLFPEDLLNRDALYEARINPVVPLRSGGCGADDDLTQWFKTNYLRFGWINDVLDYIDHRFYEGASQVKHEPDGLNQDGSDQHDGGYHGAAGHVRCSGHAARS